MKLLHFHLSRHLSLKMLIFSEVVAFGKQECEDDTRFSVNVRVPSPPPLSLSFSISLSISFSLSRGCLSHLALPQVGWQTIPSWHAVSAVNIRQFGAEKGPVSPNWRTQMDACGRTIASLKWLEMSSPKSDIHFEVYQPSFTPGRKVPGR